MHFSTQGFDSQTKSKKVKVNYASLPLISPHLYIHLLIHVATPSILQLVSL